MNFTVDKTAFATAIARVMPAVAKKTTMPALECVQVEAMRDGIVLRGTDLYQWITVPCPARVKGLGGVLVNAKALEKRVSTLGDSEIVMSQKDSRVTLTAERRKHEVHSLPFGDAPPVSDVTGDPVFRGPAALFCKLIGFAEHAMSPDTTRAHLNAMSLECDGACLRAVACDGHRVAVRELPVDGGVPWSALVPADAIAAVYKIAKGLGLDVEVFLSETSVAFRLGDIVFGAKLVNDKFPPWRQVMPKNLDAYAHLRVPRTELADCLRAAATSADDKGGGGVRLVYGESCLTISAESKEGGYSEARVDVELERPRHAGGSSTVRVALNHQYLSQSLAALEGDAVSLYVADELDIVQLGTPEARCIIMPMRGW